MYRKEAKNKHTTLKMTKMHRLKLLLVLLSFFISFNSIKAQCPTGTTVSFEKISNVNIKGVNLVPLYTGSSIPAMPVSAECNNR